MKKGRIYHVIFTLFTLGFLITSQFNISAEVPYRTRTFGPNGKLVETQMAYEPISVIKLPTLNAEDLFLAPNQTMYVADTGNGRIIILKDGVIQSTIGEGILESPTGVYVDKKIYVADSVAQKVFVFDLDGKLSLEIGRPESPLFGKNTKFIPKKVTVDSRGNIYVVSEGSTDGLVQLNSRGEFTGFFASNLTDTTLKMMIQRLFYGNTGSSTLMKNLPPSPTNATIDETGLIYTVSSGLKEDQIKKFNVSGKNMLAEKVQVPPTSFIDVAVDSFGNIFGVDELGYIYELDSYGNLLFMFGGKEKGEERVGLMKSPVAIAVAPEGTLYVLDKEKNMIQLYQATPFTHEVHEGISLYKEGLYVESESTWDNVLKRNSLFILSYQALGKSYFKRDLNQEALDSFKLAEDPVGYSEAFWEMRNDWLQSYLGIVIIALILAYLVWQVLKKIDRSKGIFNPFRRLSSKVKNQKIVTDLRYMKRFSLNPFDGCYEIKRKNRISVVTATLLYAWFGVLQITDLYLKGYIFNEINLAQVNVFRVVLFALVPILLWLISNYLISTINDGEGRFKDIYVGTIYALSPYLIFALPLQLLTNVLTLNEAFIYSFSLFIILTYCLILLFLMVKEMHNYTVGETVKNILLTLFGIILIVLTTFILYLLITHQLDFIQSIVQELKIRV